MYHLKICGEIYHLKCVVKFTMYNSVVKIHNRNSWQRSREFGNCLGSVKTKVPASLGTRGIPKINFAHM